MICHSSDPQAADYGGQNAASGKEKLCTGAVMLVFSHLKYLERLIKKGLSAQAVQKQYRAAAGKYPLTKQGQAIWAWAVATGRDVRGLKLRLTVEGRYFKEVGVPWDDSITRKEIE